jgi:hypothetical protein
MRNRIIRSSSLLSSPPRALGVDKYGRSGLDAQQFHSGPIAKKTVLVLKTNNPPRVRRRNLHRANHCGRCDSRLISGQCPSCGLDDPDEGLLGDRENEGE